jgi:hypothetical protein
MERPPILQCEILGGRGKENESGSLLRAMRLL